LLPLEGAFSFAAQYDIEATSTIQNAEINVRRQVTQTLSYLWGVRYVNWHDKLAITALDRIPAVPADQIGTAGAVTNNNLIGFQLGGGWVFPPTKKMQIAANFKAGVFGNAMDIHTYLSDPQNAAQQYDVKRSKGAGAGVFEVNAELTYALRPSLVLRGGYNVMWLTNVALAGEQSPLLLNDSGTVFLHGPSAGIECRW